MASTRVLIYCFQVFLSISVLSVTSDPLRGLDLSWPYNDKTISWAGAQKFEFIKKTAEHSPNGDWIAANEFRVAEHAGTHLDAPYHFDQKGWKVGDIPLSNLAGHGVKIDLSNETATLDHEAVLLPKHLIEWENRNGPIPTNSIVLIYFNWSQHYFNQSKYLGGEVTTDYKFPGISAEAAQWIVDTGKVFGVGLDTASVDPGKSTSHPVHKNFLKNNIYALENVKIPDSLSEKGFWIMAMPMYIGEGTGAPCRIVAYPYKSLDFTS